MQFSREEFGSKFELAIQEFSAERYAEASDLLDSVLEKQPKNPEVNAYKGLVLEALSKKEDALSFYKKAIRGFREQIGDDDLARLNLCILYDGLGDSKSLLKYLKEPKKLSITTFEGWFNWGFLYLKLYMFDQALACFENASQKKPDDIGTIEKIGFCQAGLQKYDEAIKTILKGLSLLEGRETLKTLQPELLHALGHFHSGKYVLEGDEEDRRAAVDYIEMAAEEDVTYLTCLGIIHSEAKRYHEALAVFEKALITTELRQNDYLYMETYFYRAETYLGLERYEEALEDLKHFGDFSRAVDNSVGIFYSEYYQIRTKLKQLHLEELSLEVLRGFLEDLEKYNVTLYLEPSVRIDYEKYKSFLKGLIAIKQYIKDEKRTVKDIKSSIKHFTKILDKGEKMTLLVFTDQKRIEFPSDFQNFVEIVFFSDDWILNTDLMVLLDENDVWLLVYEKEIPSTHSLILGKYLDSAKTLLAFLSEELERRLLFINSGGNALVLNESLKDLFIIAEFSLLYEKVKSFQASRITPLGGLGPGASMPVLVAPTGLLPWRKSFLTWTSVLASASSPAQESSR